MDINRSRFPPQQVSVGVIADGAINAANGGGGKFLVTTGLLYRAPDAQLRGVMAHEIAHEDLGHITKLKIAATGADMILLEQLATGSMVITPIAGPMVTLRFSRAENFDADRQSVAIVSARGVPQSGCY